MAQLVAHHTGSVGVTGSNPVSSTFNPQVHMLDLGVFIVLPGIHEKSRGGWVGMKTVSFGMNLAIFHARFDYSNMEA